jgi:hypothetical protein
MRQADDAIVNEAAAPPAGKGLPNMVTADDLLRVLGGVIRDPRTLQAAIGEFQRLMWKTPGHQLALEAEEEEVLGDLAHDLDYFDPDPRARQEEPSYFGAERALTEIRAAMLKLGRSTEA